MAKPKITTKYEEVIYRKEYAYNFYKDIKNIICSAKKEIIIIDSYINEELFNLYLEKIPPKIRIRIITNPNNPKGNFYVIAKKFALTPNIKFELKENNDCHDRMIFIDNNAWVIGQSIKDAGKKPTYLINVKKAYQLFEIFKEMWSSSIKVI
jgi:ribosomal protein L31E